MKIQDRLIEAENYYTRALYLYNMGFLDQALSYFLRTISITYNYPEAFNISGLILMYKGRFNEGASLFSINASYNKDEDSKRFLKEIIELNTCIDRFNTAADMVNQNRNKEAAAILEKLRKQGFCTQDMDILLCLLYYVDGKHSKCRDLLASIYNADKGCLFYYEMQNLAGKRKTGGRAATYAVLVILAALNLYTGYRLLKAPARVVEKEVVKYVEAKQDTQNVKQESNNKDGNLQKLMNLQQYMSSGDYLNFAKEKDKLDYNSLDEKNKKLCDGLFEKFNKNAQLNLYNSGLSFFKNKKYDKSAEYLAYAYKSNNGSYLDQHVIFFLGQSLYYLNNDDFTKYFDEYLNKYKNDSYTADAAYYMALYYYNKGDIDNAKKYAKIISEDYKDSIYNNGRVKEIMNK
jgi:TolA-binding protein